MMKAYWARAQPNIALIKYWGKKASHSDEDRNLGCNPSVSMTLSQAATEVVVAPAQGTQHDIEIEGSRANELDRKKITEHIVRIERDFGFDPQSLKIVSKNNFPQGTGIASSASAFAALTYAIAAFHRQSASFAPTELARMSALARRGSGSAARSVAGGFMKWEGSSAEALDLDWKLRDTIVIFSTQAKKVSSTDGHRAVFTSPHWEERQRKLKIRYPLCLEALAEKNLHKLGALIETEALEMHEIAETSLPPIHYRSPETLRFLEALARRPRRNFYFTIDAGPNLHLISEVGIREEVEELLRELNLEAKIWEDWTGPRPVVKELL